MKSTTQKVKDKITAVELRKWANTDDIINIVTYAEGAQIYDIFTAYASSTNCDYKLIKLGIDGYGMYGVQIMNSGLTGCKDTRYYTEPEDAIKLYNSLI